MRKSKKNSIKKRIIRIIGLLMLVIIARLVCDAITYRSDISGIRSSMSVIIEKPPDSKSLKNLHYYESLEEALKDTTNIKDQKGYKFYQDPEKNQIVKFEERDQVFLYYIPQTKARCGKALFAYVGMYKKNGKYSQPCIISTSLFDIIDDSYTYDCDDAVAKFLVKQYTYGDRFYANNGNRIFYGGLMNKNEAESLTIDGNVPDEIIPVKVEDNTYYFWYYSKTDLESKLEQIDFNDYTLQQVIDQLNIQYDKAEDKEDNSGTKYINLYGKAITKGKKHQ